MKFLAILLIFCAANCCFAIKRTTVCPTKEVVSDFDFENYMGKWFELKKYAFQSEKTYKCVTANYTLKDLTSFYFKHEYLDANNEHKGAGGNPSIGYLTFPDEKPLQGKISLIYRPKGGPNEVPKPNYFILDTDYTNYSIVWGCRNLPSSTTEFKSDGKYIFSLFFFLFLIQMKFCCFFL